MPCQIGSTQCIHGVCFRFKAFPTTTAKQSGNYRWPVAQLSALPVLRQSLHPHAELPTGGVAVPVHQRASSPRQEHAGVVRPPSLKAIHLPMSQPAKVFVGVGWGGYMAADLFEGDTKSISPSLSALNEMDAQCML